MNNKAEKLKDLDGNTFRPEPYKHYAVYTSPMGDFRDPEKYALIKEFRYGECAGKFMREMRMSGEYRKQDIIIKEFDTDENDPVKGKSVVACSVIGEYLRPEEWNF